MMAGPGQNTSRPKEKQFGSDERRTFALFCFFGGGASWFCASICWMEIPIYQRYFGLELSNRLELGYNLGTVPAALFVAASAVGLIGARRLEPRREWRAPWIAALLLLQLSTTLLLMAAHPGSPLFSMDALVLSQFAAGTVGYLAQFVIVPFLMRYENHLVGAFWTGDAASSVYAAVVALAQQPGADKPRFPVIVYYAVCALPVALLSIASFVLIVRTGAGRLRYDDAADGLDAGLDEGLCADSWQPAQTLDLATSSPLREIELVRVVSSPSLPASPRRLDPPQSASACSWVPEWMRSPLTWKLCAVVFWSQFADWGMGDSIYPYACENGARRRGLEKCEMWTNELSLVAQLLGCALAANVTLDPRALGLKLWMPVLMYTLGFFLLLYTSWRHTTARAVHDEPPRPQPHALGELGVVCIMVYLRFLGPYARAVVPRLIQPCYARQHHEHLPTFFGIAGVAGNILGYGAATILIDAHRLGATGGTRRLR